MGTVTDRAAAIVTLLKSTGNPATADVRKVRVPGFLVVPIPKYSFHTDLGGGSTLTWSVYALAKSPGDLVSAKALEDLVIGAAGVLDVETATPTSYQLPTADDPYPAYQLDLTDDMEVSIT